MLRNVKIIGAGSIGNHLANACRSCGMLVDLVDNDPIALQRTKEEIYPERYGVWDQEINLYLSSEQPRSGHDIIFVGTPPDTHLKVALEAVTESPKLIVIEKPLCDLNFKELEPLIRAANTNNIRLMVGYDHAVSESFQYFEEIVRQSQKINTLDVEFREHWGGIFAAHPWLDGPKDSYLGFYQRGGGALAEHSHGLHLYVYLCSVLNLGEITDITANIGYEINDVVQFDRISLLNIKTEKGVIGRCVQDVVTTNVNKIVNVTTEEGNYILKFTKERDSVSYPSGQSVNFEKTRPDDFIAEVRHIQNVFAKDLPSPLDIKHGIKVMRIIEAAHRSAVENCTIKLKLDHMGDAE